MRGFNLIATAATTFAVALSAVAAPNPDYVRDLSELLAIPSVSANKVETDRAIEWMQAYLAKRGVWCAVEQWPEDGRKVLCGGPCSWGRRSEGPGCPQGWVPLRGP